MLMLKKLLSSCTGLLMFFISSAQFTDNFTDGDFSNNPTWIGNTADWTVNTSFQLQSNNTVANSGFYLSTPSTQATTAQWEFFCQLTFNTSSANYVDVFLTASASDLTLNSTTGYFVRLGGTDDEICLFRKDGATVTKIIDGVNGVLNTSNNSVYIKVFRTAGNQWNLVRNHNSSGNVVEGVVTDATYSSSAFFGVLVRQSTASFFQRHFFDDIIVQDYVPDTTPPQIQSVTATSTTTADVLFNEPVELASSQDISNYSVNNGIGSPVSAVRDGSNISLVHLTFTGSFPVRTVLQMTVSNVKDLSDNILTNGTANFSLFVPFQYDVVINELMADQTPIVGLPDAEWIELRNNSPFDINLQGWRLSKPSALSGPMPNYLLRADSFVIVCTGSAVAALSAFGPVISVTSFPSLSNAGDLIILTAPSGNTIHAVNYSDAWYQNDLKKEGGWTLEMIDARNPCAGISNWKASVDPSGGTPGRKNSIDASNPDNVSPKLLRAYATDSVTVTLVFDEPMDSTRALSPANYVISDGIGSPLSVRPVAPLFNQVSLNLAIALARNRVYTVTASTSTDCAGNPIGSVNTARVGLAERIDSFDIVINEILFNPRPTSNDYVELYNRSNKILSLKNLSIANRNTAGSVSSINQLSTDDYLLFPHEFIVVTNSKALVLTDYVATNPDAFIELSSMPSYSDADGNVIILNEQGIIVDQLSYTDKWHFKLITNREGVALERIDYHAPTQNQDNWLSAASSVGYGTPTYKNSQFRADAGVQGEVTIEPEVFSPDNDGFDDFAIIRYAFPEPGYVINITIFDAIGRPVRSLQRNALSGINGYYRWDGLNDKNQKLPVGMYVIYAEIFNLQGKTKKFKKTIVLARRQ